jgi:hypothetical protein
MSRRVSEHPDDVTVYLVVNDFGEFGRAFVETDIAEADREERIPQLRQRVGETKKKPQHGRGFWSANARGGWGDDGSHSLSSTPNVAKKFGRTLSRILTGPLPA